VYRGSSLGALEPVAANDDDAVGPLGNSRVSFPVTAGDEFAIAVDGFDGRSGGFALNWTIAPPNDDFAGAAVLSGGEGTTLGTTDGATLENDEPEHSDDDFVSSSVWYRWTSPFTGTLELDPTGSDFTTVVSVFGGDRLERLRRVTYGCCATSVTRVGVTAGTT